MELEEEDVRERKDEDLVVDRTASWRCDPRKKQSFSFLNMRIAEVEFGDLLPHGGLGE